MKIILVALLSLLVSGVSVQEIQLQTLSGETLSLSKFKGKKILIVNTASYCGYTGQYAELQKLYERFKDKLEIVGMPCNQFMMQELGSNEKIEWKQTKEGLHITRPDNKPSDHAVSFKINRKENL